MPKRRDEDVPEVDAEEQAAPPYDDEPESPRLRDDVAEADAIEQAQSTRAVGGEEPPRRERHLDEEVSEADALEQSRDLPDDEDDYR